MKKILCTIVVALLLAGVAMAEDKAEKSGNKGILFQKGIWKEALTLAKKENKLVFLDIYTTWCGPCKMLKNKTFSNPSVGSFFNATFISYAIDAESAEGTAIAKQYEITGYPTLIFVNSDGDVVSRALGFHSPTELLNLGKEVNSKRTAKKVNT